MDINDGVWEGFKYLWQAAFAMVSALLSYVFYQHKKQSSSIDKLDDSYHNINTLIRVFEERIANITQDIEEIKQDLKKILFKL